MHDRVAPDDAPSPSVDDELLLRQVRAALTPMPPVHRRAIAEIMTQVAARERAPRSRIARGVEAITEWWRFAVSPLARGSALVATALVAGFVARGAWSNVTDRALPTAQTPVVSSPMASGVADAARAEATPSLARSAPLVPTDGAERRTLPVPVQFVLDARDVPAAVTVSVVGDFNDWDGQVSLMAKDGGVRSATISLLPGRHVYAFLVNGTRWLPDPRAAKAPDADFGRPGSVIIVQTPSP